MLPRRAIVTTLATSILLATGPAAHAFVPRGEVRPDIDGGVFDPTPDRDEDIACFVKKTAVDAKLAKQLLRCGRVEKRRTPATFNRTGCEKKALRRHLVKTNKGACGGTGGGGGTTARYSCEGMLCSCTGTNDCNDMFTTAGCGDVASCDTSGTEEKCSCLKSLD